MVKPIKPAQVTPARTVTTTQLLLNRIRTPLLQLFRHLWDDVLQGLFDGCELEAVAEFLQDAWHDALAVCDHRCGLAETERGHPLRKFEP